MITRTIEIEEKQFDIVVEVTRDGSPVEAHMIVAHMEDNPIPCLEAVKNSNYYSKLIAEEAATLNWNDHGDEGFSMEDFRETMARIIGVKHA